MRIESVGIAGGGFMGSGIAEAVAVAGVPVTVRDVDLAAVDSARDRIQQSLSRAVSRGKLSDDEAAAAHGRIALTTELEAIADADLVVEAVPEDERLKLEVIAAIGEVAGERTIVASNTSSIPITQLAQAISRPERVIGMHFFSPVPVMALVELVVALDTSPETLADARAFVQRIGKHPIETKDRSGFVVNMLLVPYLIAAVRMFEEGFASREDIDAGMKLGCGHPIGPLALADMIGLDVCLAIMEVFLEQFGDSKYRPCPLLREYVAAGRLGRKSGSGVYGYEK